MRNAELTLYLAVALIASLPLLRRAQRTGRGAWWWVIAALGASLAGAIAWPEPTADQPRVVDEFPGRDIKPFLPEFIADEGFTSSVACHSCHPGNYASWHRTYHRTMTQVASPQSVLAPFDDVVLENDGITYRLYRVADEYWIELPDPHLEQILTAVGKDVTDPTVQVRIPRVKRRVVMTTGSHTFQGFWVPSERARELLQVPWVYSIGERRWLPYESVFLRPPDGGRRIAMWNNSCIQCHSVDGNPNGTGDKGLLYSETVELGISCEACHGPGTDHIRKHQNPLARYRQRVSGGEDQTIVNPAKMSAAKSSEVCGQCHSAFASHDLNDWWANGFDYKAGDPLEKTRHLFHFGDQDAEATLGDAATTSYWADGTMRVGGREYLALSASPCFTHGQPESQMSCLSCHSMHHADPNDQLAERMEGNHACLQCHESYAENIEKHTHHAPTSSGSQCYNCHMPHTSYALLRALRSHRVVSPNVAGSVADGQPTGCNQCHLDKTLEWTSRHLKDWYDITPPPLTEDQQNISASVLWLLRGDAAQRAIAAWTFGWDAAHEASGDQWEAAILAQLLDDPYDAVRFMVFDSLRKLPGYRDTDYDFIAPPPERTLARRRVLEAWSRRAEDWSGRDLETVLIDPSGLRQDVVDRLQAERDDRPVEFPE